MKLVVITNDAAVAEYLSAVDQGQSSIFTAARALVRLEAEKGEKGAVDTVQRRMDALGEKGVLARVLEESGVTAELERRAEKLAAEQPAVVEPASPPAPPSLPPTVPPGESTDAGSGEST